ncbi:MAG: amino acid adenylation domain-containing protein [Actinomycetota bacterium]
MTHRFLLSTLVADAAAANPEGTAAVFDDRSLDWAGLDHRVGCLASALREAGVRRGDRVGIYLHKSMESLVAVHGVLRAGAAYVPIDPAATAATVAAIVADCNIDVLVTHDLRRAGVTALTEQATLGAVLGLSEPLAGGPRTISWAEVDAGSPAPPAPSVADDLAYVMYTSGSTGTPKGIMHTHRSGLAYATMSAAYFGLGPDDRMANFSPLHFDMSTYEVLAGVAAGATVVLIPEPHLRLPASLATYLATNRCTTLYTVPSLFQQLLARGGLADHDWSAVRWVLPAGEVFPPEPLAELVKIFRGANFSNVYGPAEVNHITSHDFTEAPADGRPLPIGRAVADVELQIVDEGDRPVADGERGLLLARTSTMMAGYWNRPDLDAAGFLDETGPGGLRHRWYRTGDLVSRDPDGVLRYYGRADNQIKIRGNRVELEMVEAAVGSLPGVEQAVVGVRADGDGDSVLVARYVATGEVEVDGWRRALATQLPPYAIPAAYQAVGRFPLTPSGKIDRRSVREDIAGG